MLSLFYEHCILKLMEPLNAPVDECVMAKELVLDLLDFFLPRHEFRVKYFLLGNNITKRVLAMTEHRERHLQLAAVRIVRTLATVRDKFFDRHLVRHHYLDPIVALLVSNGGANNLIDSAILDLFNYIRTRPHVALAKELVERHRQTLLDIRYASIPSQLVNMVDCWTFEGEPRDDGGMPSMDRSLDSPSRKRARNNGNLAGGGADLDELWLENDGGGPDESLRKTHHQQQQQQQQRQPEELMGFSILPPLPSLSSRRLLDDDDDLPLLDRHDTPPFASFTLGSSSVGPVESKGGDGDGANLFTFASALRLPSEPNALVAGLAADAARHLAEAQPGGSFWETRAKSPPPESDEGEASKRTKTEPTVTSLVDEFLKDSL